MAKTVTVEFTDEEIASLQEVYSADDADAAVVNIKNAFINLVKNEMRLYDKVQAKNNITYTPFDPK